MMNKVKAGAAKFLFAVFAVALALVTGFVSQVQLIGASLDGKQAAPTQYVGEVRIYQGETAQAATAACRADGFTPVEGNRNEGSGYDAVVLGYTTTEDKESAEREKIAAGR